MPLEFPDGINPFPMLTRCTLLAANVLVEYQLDVVFVFQLLNVVPLDRAVTLIAVK